MLAPDNGQLRAATYSRVSSWDKHGDSIDAQQQLNRATCAQRGYDLVAEFADRAVSGGDMHAPDLERALDLARSGGYEVLVTRELDRFARSLAKQLVMESRFKEAGAVVEYAIEEYGDDPQGRLLRNVRAVIAEFEREKAGERVIRGRYRSVRRGNVMVAANPPFGYRVNETADERGRVSRTLVVYEPEALWVRRIYDWYLFGKDGSLPLSDVKIAREMTNLSIPTAWDRTGRGPRRKREPGTWDSSSAQRVLKSSVYMGEWAYKTSEGDIIVEVPSIIDPATWERAQRVRAERRQRNKRRVTYPYLLHRRVICADCGYRMSAVNIQKKYFYYRCPAGRSGGNDWLKQSCTCRAYRADKIDAGVWEALKLLIGDEQFLSDALDARQDEAVMGHLSERIERAEEAIAEQRQRLSRLLVLYVEGEHTREAAQRIQSDIEKEIARLEQERDDAQRQLGDEVARVERGEDLRRFVARVRGRLKAADREFPMRRWLVEVLNVEVRLQTDGDVQRAYLDVDGEHLASIEIPQSRKPHAR